MKITFHIMSHLKVKDKNGTSQFRSEQSLTLTGEELEAIIKERHKEDYEEDHDRIYEASISQTIID